MKSLNSFATNCGTYAPGDRSREVGEPDEAKQVLPWEELAPGSRALRRPRRRGRRSVGRRMSGPGDRASKQFGSQPPTRYGPAEGINTPEQRVRAGAWLPGSMNSARSEMLLIREPGDLGGASLACGCAGTPRRERRSVKPSMCPSRLSAGAAGSSSRGGGAVSQHCGT